MPAPILYIPHGGGPLPLLGDPGHANLNVFLRGLTPRLAGARAVVVVSAHWEADQPTVTGAVNPALLYDYSGFPDAAYTITYPAPGDPDLAGRLVAALAGAGITAKSDPDRGFDHGTFVPLKLIAPEAQIPIVQLSLVSGLDPQFHMDMGKTLGALAGDNIAILGSGLSFHNMQVLMARNPAPSAESMTFDRWLNETVLSHTGATESALRGWATAPSARHCHPREEHLLPLHVCYGAAQAAGCSPINIFRDVLLGAQVSGFLWD